MEHDATAVASCLYPIRQDILITASLMAFGLSEEIALEARGPLCQDTPRPQCLHLGAGCGRMDSRNVSYYVVMILMMNL